MAKERLLRWLFNINSYYFEKRGPKEEKTLKGEFRFRHKLGSNESA